MAKITATSYGISSSTLKIKRPKFNEMWSNYPVGMEAPDVYATIGGNVYELYKENPTGYANACALRLSRAFNYGGFKIAKSGPGYKVKGGDGKIYFLRVKDVIAFVKSNFGKPDYSVKPNAVDKTSDFLGKKGILIFDVSGWGDASGHVTLWNGGECGDHCYFTHPTQPDVQTKEILFWELK
jgi:hypothetical protein